MSSLAAGEEVLCWYFEWWCVVGADSDWEFGVYCGVMVRLVVSLTQSFGATVPRCVCLVLGNLSLLTKVVSDLVATVRFCASVPRCLQGLGRLRWCTMARTVLVSIL